MQYREISGSHSGPYEHYCLVGFDAVQAATNFSEETAACILMYAVPCVIVITDE